MKSMILGMLSVLSFASVANANQEIQVVTGESITITNKDCKSSEYTFVKPLGSKDGYWSNPLDTKTMETECRPKICLTEKYISLHGWRLKITLEPENKALFDGPFKEGSSALDQYLSDGTCAVRKKHFQNL